MTLCKKNWKALMLFMALMTFFVITGCSNEDDPDKTEESTEKMNTSSQATEQSEHRIIAGTVVIAEILDKLELDAIAVPETEKKH